MGFNFKVAPGVRVGQNGWSVGPSALRYRQNYDGSGGWQHNVGVGPISHNGYHPNQPQAQQSSGGGNLGLWILLGVFLGLIGVCGFFLMCFMIGANMASGI